MTAIQFDRHSRFDLTFNGIPVFLAHSLQVLTALEAANGGALFGLGAVLIPELSIGTNCFFTGFAPNRSKLFWEDAGDNPPNVLNIETAGAYVPYLDHYVPIDFTVDNRPPGP